MKISSQGLLLTISCQGTAQAAYGQAQASAASQLDKPLLRLGIEISSISAVKLWYVGQASGIPSLIAQQGQEFFDKGVHIALAPVSAGPLGRAPLGGRNWEGSFPDAYANGVYSYESVRGMQDSHVAATM